MNVLNLISNTYQDYSGQERDKEIIRTIIYLKEQVEEYQIKSNKAFKLVQEFGKANNISYEKISKDNQNIFKTDVETIRLEALQELNEIKFQLEKIENLVTNDDRIIYMTSPQDLEYQRC